MNQTINPSVSHGTTKQPTNNLTHQSMSPSVHSSSMGWAINRPSKQVNKQTNTIVAAGVPRSGLWFAGLWILTSRSGLRQIAAIRIVGFARPPKIPRSRVWDLNFSSHHVVPGRRKRLETGGDPDCGILTLRPRYHKPDCGILLSAGRPAHIGSHPA